MQNQYKIGKIKKKLIQWCRPKPNITESKCQYQNTVLFSVSAKTHRQHSAFTVNVH